MLKKLSIIAASSALCCAMSAHAGMLYLGPGVSVVDAIVPQSNYRGLQPVVFVGYSDWLQDMFLAGEVFAVPASITLEDNYEPSLSNSKSVKPNTSYGASILPGGTVMDCVLAFARFGVIYSKFTGPNSWRMGGQVGAGIQLDVSRYWDVRVEYDYSFYRSMTSIGTPRTDQAGISLIYKVLN